MGRISLTYPTALVLQAIAAGHRYGFDVMDATGLASGTVYPALRRLERQGAVEGHWEAEASARDEGRPSRRYYVLTALGVDLAETARSRYPGLSRAIGDGRGGLVPSGA